MPADALSGDLSEEGLDNVERGIRFRTRLT